MELISLVKGLHDKNRLVFTQDRGFKVWENHDWFFSHLGSIARKSLSVSAKNCFQLFTSILSIVCLVWKKCLTKDSTMISSKPCINQSILYIFQSSWSVCEVQASTRIARVKVKTPSTWKRWCSPQMVRIRDVKYQGTLASEVLIERH